MSFLPAVAGILSAVLGAAGAVVQAQQQAAALEQQAANEQAAADMSRYQQKVIDMNKKLMEDNAARSVSVAQITQQEQDQEAKALIGEQIAQQGASGLSLGGRSQILTRKSAATLGRKDALNIRYAGEVDKYNILTEAANLNTESVMKGMEAGSYDRSAEATRGQAGPTLLSGFIGGMGSLLGAASSFKFGAGGSSKSVARPYNRPASLAI